MIPDLFPTARAMPTSRRSLGGSYWSWVLAIPVAAWSFGASAAPPKRGSNPTPPTRVEPSEGTAKSAKGKTDANALEARRPETNVGEGRMQTRKKTTRVAMAPAATDTRTSGQSKKPERGSATRNKTAGTDSSESERTASAKRTAAPSRPSGSKKISIEDDFLIEGKLEKPSAYYILRRSRAEYDWARLDAKFLPLVLESVQDPLF